MPWRVETVMSQRKEFVALAQSEGVSMSELCLRSGISRKTGYKWLRRYLEGGKQSLDDLPKRPHHSPNRTSADMEQLVVDLRREHPTKGGHVLARILKDPGHNSVPSKSTITAILRRHQLIEPSESLKHKPYKRFEHERPNQLWQMDFKGHIPVGSGGRCHPLTVLDDHSRFSLGVRACADERTQTVHDHLTSIFSHYGMPNTILVDNGSPWGSDLDHPFTPLTVWLVQLGVRVDLDTPASRYTVSPRSFPETLPTVDYDTDDQVGSVDVNGRISFLGRSFPVGKAFRGKRVALRPTPTDGTWKVFFSIQSIAPIDLNQ